MKFFHWPATNDTLSSFSFGWKWRLISMTCGKSNTVTDISAWAFVNSYAMAPEQPGQEYNDFLTCYVELIYFFIFNIYTST